MFAVHAAIPLFDRARPERALAGARAAQAEAQATAFRVALRGEIAALRAAVVERRDAAERYRAEAVNSADQIERIAQVSYDAGERGILELLGRLSNRVVRPRASGHSRRRRAPGGNRTGIRQRLGDSVMKPGHVATIVAALQLSVRRWRAQVQPNSPRPHGCHHST